MRATNFALRPLIKDEGEQNDGWEILQIMNDDTNTVFTQRVGLVDSPQMGFSPLTLLQFLLSCYNDQHPSEETEEHTHDEADSQEVE